MVDSWQAVFVALLFHAEVLLRLHRPGGLEIAACFTRFLIRFGRLSSPLIKLSIVVNYNQSVNQSISVPSEVTGGCSL
jgi:hypothetical protein